MKDENENLPVDGNVSDDSDNNGELNTEENAAPDGTDAEPQENIDAGDAEAQEPEDSVDEDTQAFEEAEGEYADAPDAEAEEYCGAPEQDIGEPFGYGSTPEETEGLLRNDADKKKRLTILIVVIAVVVVIAAVAAGSVMMLKSSTVKKDNMNPIQTMFYNISKSNNKYNKLGYVDVSGRTLQDVAESAGMSVDELKETYGLPEDMEPNTTEAAAYYSIPVGTFAKMQGMTFDDIKEILQFPDSITEESTWGEAEGETTLAVHVGEEYLDQFKEEYGLGDDITIDTKWKDVRNIVDQKSLDERLAEEAEATESPAAEDADEVPVPEDGGEVPAAE